MKFASRRVDCPGYLEFIWRADLDLKEGERPPTIALVMDDEEGRFHGMYGLLTVVGNTVAAVKQELFSMIEEGH